MFHAAATVASPVTPPPAAPQPAAAPAAASSISISPSPTPHPALSAGTGVRAICSPAWSYALVISRFILLDSVLLYFTFHGMVKFHSYQNRCVNRRSHQFKWVGLFAIALIGLCSMEDLWEKFGGFR
ncbi:unnamed protein product, partial [Tilletia laevis]